MTKKIEFTNRAKKQIEKIINEDQFKKFFRISVKGGGCSGFKYDFSFDEKTNLGTYISKLEPGTKTLPHIHSGYEEFLILKGELTDPDGKTFKKGDFISFEPGSTHSSFTKDGCLVLVFMRGINEPI